MTALRSVVRTAVWLLALAIACTAPASAPARSLDEASATAKEDLARSLAELSELRKEIAAEKIPLNRRIAELEGRLSALRAEQDRLSRSVDTKNVDFQSLQADVQARREEKVYLENLVGEYVRNFETRIDVAELQRYRDPLEAARLASENTALPPEESLAMQTAVVELSVDRLGELLGGATFDGEAVGPDGRLEAVRFAILGPITVYSSRSSSGAGLAEQKLGSIEPNLTPFESAELSAGVRAIVERGEGMLPFDPTLGNARRVEETRETWTEHVRKGGPVMIPILLLAAAALIVALAKAVQLARTRIPSVKEVDPLLGSVRAGDFAAARRAAGSVPGPAGEMLRAGAEQLGEPKDLVEEVMFEKMLETRLKLQAFLPFVALAASAAPLLGLLGTVTGMITTFKLITVFGSGDAKTLSGGISEALITTEFGLIVAIPALLLYAYLSRKSRAVVDAMEKTAVAFLNRIPSRSAIPERVVAEAG